MGRWLMVAFPPFSSSPSYSAAVVFGPLYTRLPLRFHHSPLTFLPPGTSPSPSLPLARPRPAPSLSPPPPRQDPRLTVAWAKKHSVPLEKLFSKTLITKFPWALAEVEANPEWRF